MKKIIGIAVAGLAAIAMSQAVVTTAGAQDIDPALQASWDYMQEQMPGVPYSLLTAACAEGEVMVYHGSWADAEDLQIQGFNKRFPCLTVRKLGGGMSDIRERFLAEYRAGLKVADLVQDSSSAVLDEHAKAGYLSEYTISNDDKFADDAKHTGYWYSMRRGMAGIAWNTDLVSDEDAAKLTEWEGILDPRWKDVAAVGDISAGGVAYLPFYAWYQLYGDEFYKKLGELNVRNIAGTNNAAAALASGDVEVLFNASETALVPLYNKGAPIKWSLPPPGVGPLTGQSITSNAPHPNAARLFQEYTFSEEGYGLFQSLGGVPTRIGTPDAREVAAEPWYKVPAEMFVFDEKEANEAVPMILEKFNEYVGTARN
ncbi:MAG TPA: ABC transporter substrate-binding protein [Devosia sp.]|nr:ABC transporter substrate-binding protein [Devosia sp.]